MLDFNDMQRYVGAPVPDLSYATVRDFCDSADYLPQLMRFDGDLKDVQRTWMVKAILGTLAVGSRLLEIGAGEPIVASALQKVGYDVTVVDPYDGTGNGPRAYEQYMREYPGLQILKAYFDRDAAALAGRSYEGIYSISVLEHVPDEGIADIFAAIGDHLRPGGYSIHCVDDVVEGIDRDWHQARIREVVFQQKKLENRNHTDSELRQSTDDLLERYFRQMREDLETFYLSALGHNVWRGDLPYDEFPFRKVVSVQTCICASK